MKVELYYLDGCRSYRQARENLRQALQAEGRPERIDMIRVADETDARAKRFIGSPTIRLDGADIEGTKAGTRGYGFGCRVYTAGGRMAGWPSVEQIRHALRHTSRERRSGRAAQGKDGHEVGD